LFIISYLFLGDKFTGLIAIANNFLAAIVTFIVGTYLLKKFLPKRVRKTTPIYLGRTWIYIALPFFVISGLQAANSHIAILVLGFYVDAAEIGVFSVALRIAGLLSFFLLSANAILAPNIAILYNKNEHEQLQKMVTKSARIILLLSFPVTLILIIFGDFILSIFGKEFVAGYKILIILSIGQLFNAAMGSVGLLLTMTRHEHDMLWGVLIGFVINATLNMFLIPLYGAIGAAISTTIYTLLWNVIIAILVFKRIDIIPSIIGRKK